MAPRIYFISMVSLLLCYSTQTLSQTTFTDVALTSGIDNYTSTFFDMGGGVALFDYNKDSLIDIFYTGGKRQDVLYRNNGNGSFTDVSLSAGLGFTDSTISMGVTTGDIDNDGYRDIFVVTLMGQPNYLLHNNGNGTFTNISAAAGIDGDSLFALSATFGDYDKDGFLDLYVGNYVDTPSVLVDSLGNLISFNHICSSNTLFHNNGNGTFTDVSSLMNVGDAGCALASTFTDYDSDGDVDVWVANDFGAWILPDALYQNNYPSSFSNVSSAANVAAQIYGMGIAVGDYDQDLDLDYYVTNLGRNVLHRSNGNGTFIDTADAAGVSNQWVFQDSLQSTGWGTGFMDIDNDTYLDLFVGNGFMASVPQLMTTMEDPDKMFYNNGDGTFSDISSATGMNSNEVTRGFAFGDYDNDGDVDLFPVPVLIGSSVDTSSTPVYRNNLSNSNNWLKVSLEGTLSNRDAFGSQILIYVGGKSWVHEILGGSSHASQHSSVAHFGLGTASVVDSLVIKWTNGLTERLTNISPNQTLYLVEGTVTGNHQRVTNSFSFDVFPNPTKQNINIRYNLHKSASITLTVSNLIGQVVWKEKRVEQSAGEQAVTLDASQLSNGVYFVSFEAEGQVLTQKIIVQH